MKYNLTHFGDVSGDGVMALEGAWNIADGFTKIKILRPLIEMDLYENYALFGKKDLDEPTDPATISKIRVEALYRIYHTLAQVMGNSRFAIRAKKDKVILSFMTARLTNIEPYLETIASVRLNHITHEEHIEIHEEQFRNVFNIVKELKDELNTILDNASIIFRKGEELDIESIMRDVEEGV